MSEKCICHLNGYRIKDSIARKAIEDLQKAFDGLEIADGLDLEEIKQLIQNEIAKLDTTGLTESEVQTLIENAWTTYEEPLINQKIEEAIASSEALTESEVQEMINTTASAVDTQLTAKMNSAITEAVNGVDEFVEGKISEALAGFEGGGSNAYNVIRLTTNSGTLSSEILNSFLNNPLNSIININGIRYIFSNESNTTLSYTEIKTGFSSGVVPYEKINTIQITKSTGSYSMNSEVRKYYIPAPSSTNAGKVLAVKADGTGYEFIEV